jgi:2-keto-4-pentenoate hydratase
VTRSSNGDIDAAVDQLVGAYQSGQPIEPLATTYPALTIDDAYEIQWRQLERRLAETDDLGNARRLIGHKVGLTSPAMQQQMQVTQPDSGYLLDDMIYPEHDDVALERFLQPRVEPEVAFLLKRDLAGPGVTVAEAIGAIEWIVPAIEIIDSRIRDWRISIVDTIADNASS